MRDSQGSFMDSLTAAARENPLAAALIGGGALWLLMGGDKLRNAVAPLVEIGTRAQRSAASSWGETSGSVRASQMQDQAARSIDLASFSINDTVRNARMAASDAMSGAAETMNERLDEGVAGAREMFDRLGQALPKKETLRQAQFSLSDLMERQPLVLGAVGLAIGATVAGALAKSSLEDEWVGELSDGLKADLKERAGAVSQSVREASDTVKAEFADAGAEYADRVQQAGRDALDVSRETLQQ